MAFLKKNKIIIIIVAVIVAGFAWYAFSDRGGAPPPLLNTQAVGPSTTAAEKTLVETLVTLRAITLSGTIFSDPAFQSLQDFGTQIVPEPVGRRDPFAPLDENERPSGASQNPGTPSSGGGLPAGRGRP